MATGSYRIKTNNNYNSIYYRFKQGKQFDIEISTNIQVPKDRWSQSKKQVLKSDKVDADGINLKLRGLNDNIIRLYNDTKIAEKKNIIDSTWLKNNIQLYLKQESTSNDVNEKIFFASFIEKFITDSAARKTKNNTPIKPRTIQHYQTTLNKIIAFENYIKQKVNLDSVDLDFHTKFIHYLENTEKLGNNTIGGYIDDIKLFCRSALLKNIKISMEFNDRQFYSPSNSTQDIYLKEEEIIKIYSTEYEKDYLDNARDWLIIGLRTGLRVSDLLSLTDKQIVDGYIQLRSKKTDYPVIIPLHKNVTEILAKRNGKFPRQISDPKFNQYIKQVAMFAGITEITTGAKIMEQELKIKNKIEVIHRKVIGEYSKYELVSSHICRRTFATLLYGKLDTATIMRITGHQTEKQFLTYIKITPTEYAERLKNYWKTMGDLIT